MKLKENNQNNLYTLQITIVIRRYGPKKKLDVTEPKQGSVSAVPLAMDFTVEMTWISKIHRVYKLFAY